MAVSRSRPSQRSAGDPNRPRDPQVRTRPRDVEELSAIVNRAYQEGRRVCPVGHGSRIADATPGAIDAGAIDAGAVDAGPVDIHYVDVSRLNRVIHHTPEDLVARVECGLSERAFHDHLATARQRVPMTGIFGDSGTIGGRLATAAPASTMRRYGSVRDWVIGTTIVRFDGSLAHSGGNVVKNVSGYDMTRLHIGSFGELGILVEAAFKLDPMPQACLDISAMSIALSEVRDLVDRLDTAGLAPCRVVVANPAQGHVDVHASFEGPHEWIRAAHEHARHWMTEVSTLETSLQARNVRVRLHHDDPILESLLEELGSIDSSFGETRPDGPAPERSKTASVSLLGAGVTFRAWDDLEHLDRRIAAYREAAVRHGGWLVVERMPRAYEGAIDRIVVPPDAWALMRIAKAELDPAHTFTAGIAMFDWARP